jgi:hypothetical protein
MSKLEEYEQHHNGIEEIKLHSFYHYLKKIDFKGYGKWYVLSQCIKEEHP